MGQKVNPVGFRLGVNRGWDSVWYAKKKDFGNYLIEDFKIREYIKKNVINSGVSKVMIERTSNKCYVTIYTSRPGFVIGKKGSDIDKIKNNLSKFTTNEVNLNIKEVKKPETNAYLVAENIAQQLVKRISYRRALLYEILFTNCCAMFSATKYAFVSGFLTSLIFKLTSFVVNFDKLFLILSISLPFLPITNPGLDV